MPVWIPAFFMRCRSVLLLILFHLQSHKREPSGCIDTVIRGKAEPEKHLLSENQRGAQKQRPQKTSAKPDLVADGATVPVQLWSASARMKRAKKSRKKSRAMPKNSSKSVVFLSYSAASFRFSAPCLRLPKTLPHPNYGTQRFFCQEMRLSQMKTKWKQNARRLSAKDEAKGREPV